MATIDIQDKDECVFISTDDNDIILTEEESVIFFKILLLGIKVMINDFRPN